MSSRKMAWRLPSASITSIDVFDSEPKSADHPPFDGGNRVLHEVPLDAAAGIEDMDHELLPGNDGHAR